MFAGLKEAARQAAKNSGSSQRPVTEDEIASILGIDPAELRKPNAWKTILRRPDGAIDIQETTRAFIAKLRIQIEAIRADHQTQLKLMIPIAEVQETGAAVMRKIAARIKKTTLPAAEKRDILHDLSHTKIK